MPKFTVTLKRVVYAEVVIEAPTAKDVREQVKAAGEHETFVTSDSIVEDTTTIVSVKPQERRS